VQEGGERPTQIGRACGTTAGPACIGGWNDYAVEAGTTCFGDASFALAAGSKSARQADLPEHRRPGGKRLVALR